MKWGSLVLCAICIGISAVPWVTGNSDMFCLFMAGMNLQAFIESCSE